jgi:hypothetical protein
MKKPRVENLLTAILKGIVEKIWYMFIYSISFKNIEVSTPFLLKKLTSISCRIFKYSTFRSEFLLKGPWHKIFNVCFFHQTTFPGSLIHRLKPFWIWLRIREDNWLSRLHSSVIDTVVKPTYCRIFSQIIWHTVFIWKSDSAAHRTAVSVTLLCKYDTAVTLGLTFKRLWLPLKGISMEKTYIGKLSCSITITFTQKIWGS